MSNVPQPQAYPQHAAPVYMAAAEPKTNGLAIASMVLGLVAIVGVPIYLIPFIGVVTGWTLALLAVIFGGVALNQIKKKAQRGKGQAITGLVLGVIVLIPVFLITVAGGAFLSALF